MAIVVDDVQHLFTLHTAASTYQMKAEKHGFLLHLYYGAKVENTDFSYLLRLRDRGFSGNPSDAAPDRTISADTMPLEYPCTGIGDYRESCLDVLHADGSRALDLRYESYTVVSGKPENPGLPGIYAENSEAETLIITLCDRVSGLKVQLYYSVLEDADIITRHARIVNGAENSITLLRALSACVDQMQFAPRDVITFYGRHAAERTIQRSPVRHGKIRVDSLRGASSAHENPFLILCDETATETSGECMGALFVYSGNFLAQAELDQGNLTRVIMGIHPQLFCWQLSPEAVFCTPEVILCRSGEGLGGLSNKLHDAINTHLVRGKYRDQRRPILINNWEATYFDFDEEKLVRIAEKAKDLGIELFVLDDGWFGKRNDDTTSLGDWFVNTEKLKNGLRGLSSRIHGMGMQFGLWVEPEMISLQSELYRQHPDWMLRVPGRAPVSGRCQYVLDLSREDVVEHLYSVLSGLIGENEIDYIKWDMNRNISDIWSNALPAQRQGEVLHRYILGVYELMERLLQRFPNLLLETCSGGGGRFDAGMLYYSPQIWCSDNTDPVERLRIQYGTSFAYPCSAMGAHVSASPNHQTGRTTPLNTRGAVAMCGTFGYELDPSILTEAEQAQIRVQTAFFKEHWATYSQGSFYRLTGNPDEENFTAWLHVAKDKKEAIVTCVCRNPVAYAQAPYVQLRGLPENAQYRVSDPDVTLSGRALMTAGLPMPDMVGNYPAFQILLTQVQTEENT